MSKNSAVTNITTFFFNPSLRAYLRGTIIFPNKKIVGYNLAVKLIKSCSLCYQVKYSIYFSELMHIWAYLEETWKPRILQTDQLIVQAAAGSANCWLVWLELDLMSLTGIINKLWCLAGRESWFILSFGLVKLHMQLQTIA